MRVFKRLALLSSTSIDIRAKTAVVHKVVVTRKRRLTYVKKNIYRVARVASRFLLTTTCLRVPKAHVGQTTGLRRIWNSIPFVTAPDEFRH